jgi:hypothetical protein
MRARTRSSESPSCVTRRSAAALNCRRESTTGWGAPALVALSSVDRAVAASASASVRLISSSSASRVASAADGPD